VICGDAGEQAVFVAQRVLQLREEGMDLNQMAVLYRSHFHTLELQLELTRRNIPFTITSGIRFFEQAHLKDVVAYLKLVANPRDELAFKRLVQLLPGIGGKGADKLWKLFHAATQLSAQAEPAKPEQLSTLNSQLSTPQAPAKPEQLSTLNSQLSTQAERPLATTLLAPALARMGGAVPKKATVAWANFVTTIAQLEADPVRDHPDQMLKLVIEAGYDEYLKENYTNYRSRLEDLEELASFARQINGTHEFLAQLSLLTNIEAEDEQVAARDDEHLRLSTIHQAKGLEFDVVFVIMLCDGLFPSARSSETPEGEEEERRLFYVAITRAKSELYLSFPMTRATYGRGDAVQHPSRFLKEIPSELMDPWNLRSASWGTGEGSEPF
jgi:DNA helicase-2/ATP-dependent DNA helicase PcrA